jgi:electron transfer flavoprotein alpha subunit
LDQKDYKNIWVLVERRNGGVHQVSYELLSKGQRLKEASGERLAAVVLGNVDEGERASLESYGAEEIVVIESKNEMVESYELQAELICRAVREARPQIILAGATAFGRTLMPLVAVRVKTGLTADCTDLEFDRERKILLQTRPAFGGNIMAVIECPLLKPQMATVRPHVFKPERKAVPARAKVKVMKFSPVISRSTRVLQRFVEEGGVDISQADVVVSGGRGLGKPEGFDLLKDFAHKLGGVVGASRGAVDLGWISSAHQVGQTGHTVTPRLYIACGISGAIQHVAGMKGAEIIIAINEDPDAPIFEMAEYGIIGDLYEVIPQILKELGTS